MSMLGNNSGEWRGSLSKVGRLEKSENSAFRDWRKCQWGSSSFSSEDSNSSGGSSGVYEHSKQNVQLHSQHRISKKDHKGSFQEYQRFEGMTLGEIMEVTVLEEMKTLKMIKHQQ